MQGQNQTVLSISCNYQLISHCLFKDGELIDWNIRSFKEPGGKKKRHKMSQYLMKLISNHRVTHVVLKKNEAIECVLHKVIKKQRHSDSFTKIVVVKYSLNDLKKRFGLTNKNRSQLIRTISSEILKSNTIPFLQLKTTLNYYYNLIEAMSFLYWKN